MNRPILNWKGHIVYQSESCTASNIQHKAEKKKDNIVISFFLFSWISRKPWTDISM